MVTAWMRRVLSGSLPAYGRQRPLVLVNGLAEQPETWYANLPAWRRHFDVHVPRWAAYDGPVIQRRIDAGEAIDIEFLVEQLRAYLTDYVQTPADLLANSMGGKVAVECAARYPELVRRLVLLCPSGLAAEERLPIVDGVRRSDLRSMVESVFYNPAFADRRVLAYYQDRFRDKRWRSGLLRTIRGTMQHSVRNRLRDVPQPTLLVVGMQDRIVDPRESIEAGRHLRHGRVVTLDRCGHAPQIEQSAVVNRLVLEFLRADEPLTARSA